MTTTTMRLHGAATPYIAGTKQGAPRPDLGKYRSLGELVVAAQKDASAEAGLKMLARAYAGATTADAGFSDRSTPLGEDVLLFASKRPLLSVFQHAELPPSRNFLEWQRLATVTGDADEQDNEGDDLDVIEVSIAAAGTYRVRTVGARSQISRQIHDRSPALVTATLRAQVLAYNRRAESIVRTVLTGLTGTATGSLAFANRTKAVGGWQDTAIDAIEKIEDADAIPSAWVMSRVQYKQLASVVDGSSTTPVFVPNQNAGTIGGVPIRAWVCNVPVITDPGLAAGTSYMVAANALVIREDEPLKLAADNVVSLYRDLSLAGYLAVEPADPKAVVKITHPAA